MKEKKRVKDGLEASPGLYCEKKKREGGQWEKGFGKD